jgi:hypothetical protein
MVQLISSFASTVTNNTQQAQQTDNSIASTLFN